MTKANGKFPSFLGIGAQKAGTTWLHRMLSMHDDVWLPHVKELHYFDRKFPIGAVGAVAASTTGPRRYLFGHLRTRMQKLSIARLTDRLSFRRWQDLSWELRYMFGDWTDEWYASLFAGAGRRVPGEITPAYSCLGETAIRHVHGLIPDAKIILLLRNPIDRAWSHAKMDFESTGTMNRTDEEYFAHFNGAASRQRGDYAGMMTRWLSVFPKEQLIVGFYDEIAEAPRELMIRICTLLGVSTADRSMPPVIVSRVNASTRASLPPNLHEHLARLYMDSIEELARQFPSYPARWLEECHQALGRSETRQAMRP